MGVDILDIVYRLEKKFSIRIDRDNIVDQEEWKRVVRSKQKTQKELHDEFVDRFTVKFLCDLVEQKIREKNEGIDDLPYGRAEIEHFVAEALIEALAVKPEEIKPDARIIKDLGAA